MISSSKHFLSVSAKPGTFGETIYSYFFALYNLPFTYRSAAILNNAAFYNLLEVFRSTNIFSGLSVSMPFKSLPPTFCPFLNSPNSPFISFSNVANTVYKINDDCQCTSTDILIFKYFFSTYTFTSPILIYGTGAMSSLCCSYLDTLGLKYLVFSRNEITKLQDAIHKSTSFSALINATPLPIERLVNICNINFPVLDLSVRFEQSLIDNQHIFSGFESTLLQFSEQFLIYTGIHIDSFQLSKAVSSCFSLHL